jgi:uridine kinase
LINNLVIAFTGGSGSGKTSLARALQQSLGKGAITLLSQDSFYRDLSHLSEKEREITDFDLPDAIDLAAFHQCVRGLKAGKDVEIPRYDYASHCRTGVASLLPSPLICVEGLFLYGPFEEVGLWDVKVFVQAPADLRLERRLARDILERGGKRQDEERRFFSRVVPAHDLYIEPQKHDADHVLDGSRPLEHLLDELLSAHPEWYSVLL